MQKLKTTNAPTVILRIEELKRTTRMTLFNLAHLEKLNIAPTQELLATMGGTSRSTIKRELAELEEKGYITRTTKYLNGKGRQTTISIIWNKITSQAEDYDWYDDKQQTPNVEIENKPILTPQITQDDNQYQPEVENGLNSLKMGNNEIIEDNAYMEQNIEDNNKENDIEDMGNLLVFDNTTGQYKYPSKTKEQIKEKVLEKNLPTVQVAATTQVPDEPTMPSFQEFLKKTAHTINDIIKDFRAGGIRATVQAPVNLKDFLNTKLGRFYKEEIEEYIKARVNPPVEEPAAFISDEDKYGSDVMDFIEDNQEILEALKATVDYSKYKEEDKKLAAINANKKINSIVAASGKNNSEFVTRLEKFCMDYSVSYDESKSNSLNYIDYAA